MAVQMTIIGLGQFGASIGLALGKHKEVVWRVGHDLKAGVEREALKRGAVDKTEHHLPSAVKDSKLVVLCLPLSQVRATLKFIAPHLTQGTVVLDTSPVKSEVVNWADELLPGGCYYVGLAPAINPEALHDLRIGLDAAREDLFEKSFVLVDAPPGTPGEAAALASNFVHLLGAMPLVTDMLESDGLMASTHILPQLVAAALLNTTVDQPGWRDARKIAGRAYAALTAGLAYQDEIDSLQMSALQNRRNVVHALDVMLAALRGLRDDIENGDEDGIADRLEAAQEGHQRWLSERASANWEEETRSKAAEAPSFAERLFGSAIAKKRRRE